MKSFQRLWLLIFVLFFVTSCVTQRTATNNYLQNRNDSAAATVITIPEPVIKKNDLLSIRVFSMSIDPQTDVPYNLPETGGGTGGTTTGGFLVDQDGNIEYPRIGKIRAEGLTKAQLADVIREKLEPSLRNPSVIIRFLNYRVTILGEVGSQSTFNVLTERITVLEALGLAGGVTDYGNKNNVKILREKNGTQEIGTLDLTSTDIFSSPYYYLQQNDVVFVEQNRRKMTQQDQQQLAQQIGLFTSIITAVALILNILK